MSIRIRCSTARENGACSNDGRYRLDRIEVVIVEHLREHLSHADLQREYLRAYL